MKSPVARRTVHVGTAATAMLRRRLQCGQVLGRRRRQMRVGRLLDPRGEHREIDEAEAAGADVDTADILRNDQRVQD